MKKRIPILVLCFLMCFVTAFAIGACSDPHVHTFSAEYTFDETSHWHASTCEHTAEVDGKAEHVWNGGTITTAATCTTEGVMTYTCIVCPATKTKAIPKHGHTLTTVYAVAANCTTAGAIEHYSCSACDKLFSDANTTTEITAEQIATQKDATNHVSDEFTYVANGDGTHTKKNQCCGAVVTDDERCSGGEATCTDKAECDKCGGEYGTTIAHTYNQKVMNADTLVTAGDCMNKAVYNWSCECGDISSTLTFEGEKDPANHKLNTFVYEQVAGTSTHQKKHECCGVLVGEPTACGGGADIHGVANECSTCGSVYGETPQHTWVEDTTVAGAFKSAANCMDKAVYWKSCACGAISDTLTFEYGEKEPTEHKLDTFIYEQVEGTNTHQKKHECCEVAVNGVAPENCSGGSNTHGVKNVCSTCNTAYGEIVPHVWEENAVAAAIKADGDCLNETEYWKTCACGAVSDELYFEGAVDPTVHNKATFIYEQVEGTNTHQKKHECCEVAVNGVAPENCSGGSNTHGVKNVCSICNTAYGEIVSHVWEENAVASAIKTAGDCLNETVYWKSCACEAISDEFYFEGAVDPTVHNMATFIYEQVEGTNTHQKKHECCEVAVDGVAAEPCTGGSNTCGQQNVCSTCNTAYGEAIDHVMQTGDAWTTSETEHWRQCTRPGCTYIDEDSRAEHDFVTDPQQLNCSVCGAESGHVHEYNQENTTLPNALKTAGTCKIVAVYYKSCTCGQLSNSDTFNGTTDSSNHESKEFEYTHITGTETHQQIYACCKVAVNGVQPEGCAGGTATCTAKANCAKCGAEHGNMLDHEYTNAAKTAAALKANGTCLKEAEYYYTCANCDAIDKSAEAATFKGDKDAANHELATFIYEQVKDTETHQEKHECCGVATNAQPEACDGGTATCTELAECAKCHSTYGELEAHDFTKEVQSDNTLKTAGTCVSEAEYYYTCQNCDAIDKSAEAAIFKGEINANNHDMQWVNTDAAEHYKQCQRGEDCEYIDESTRAEHGYSNAIDEECDVCGYNRGHQHVKADTLSHDASGHWYACTNTASGACEEKLDWAEHGWGEGVVTTPSTCTEAGVRTFTCECTEKKSEAEPVAAHTLTKTDAVAPTCTEDGTVDYWTCSVCNKMFLDELGKNETDADGIVDAAKGHNYEGAAWLFDENDEEAGHWQKCNNCDHLTNDPVQPHEYGSDHINCTVCDYVIPTTELTMTVIDSEGNNLNDVAFTIVDGENNVYASGNIANGELTASLPVGNYTFKIAKTATIFAYEKAIEVVAGDIDSTKTVSVDDVVVNIWGTNNVADFTVSYNDELNATDWAESISMNYYATEGKNKSFTVLPTLSNDQMIQFTTTFHKASDGKRAHASKADGTFGTFTNDGSGHQDMYIQNTVGGAKLGLNRAGFLEAANGGTVAIPNSQPGVGNFYYHFAGLTTAGDFSYDSAYIRISDVVYYLVKSGDGPWQLLGKASATADTPISLTLAMSLVQDTYATNYTYSNFVYKTDATAVQDMYDATYAWTTFDATVGTWSNGGAGMLSGMAIDKTANEIILSATVNTTTLNSANDYSGIGIAISDPATGRFVNLVTNSGSTSTWTSSTEPGVGWTRRQTLNATQTGVTLVQENEGIAMFGAVGSTVTFKIKAVINNNTISMYVSKSASEIDNLVLSVVVDMETMVKTGHHNNGDPNNNDTFRNNNWNNNFPTASLINVGVYTFSDEERTTNFDDVTITVRPNESAVESMKSDYIAELNAYTAKYWYGYTVTEDDKAPINALASTDRVAANNAFKAACLSVDKNAAKAQILAYAEEIEDARGEQIDGTFIEGLYENVDGAHDRAGVIDQVAAAKLAIDNYFAPQYATTVNVTTPFGFVPGGYAYTLSNDENQIVASGDLAATLSFNLVNDVYTLTVEKAFGKTGTKTFEVNGTTEGDTFTETFDVALDNLGMSTNNTASWTLSYDEDATTAAEVYASVSYTFAKNNTSNVDWTLTETLEAGEIFSYSLKFNDAKGDIRAHATYANGAVWEVSSGNTSAQTDVYLKNKIAGNYQGIANSGASWNGTKINDPFDNLLTTMQRGRYDVVYDFAYARVGDTVYFFGKYAASEKWIPISSLTCADASASIYFQVCAPNGRTTSHYTYADFALSTGASEFYTANKDNKKESVSKYYDLMLATYDSESDTYHARIYSAFSEHNKNSGVYFDRTAQKLTVEATFITLNKTHPFGGFMLSQDGTYGKSVVNVMMNGSTHNWVVTNKQTAQAWDRKGVNTADSSVTHCQNTSSNITFKTDLTQTTLKMKMVFYHDIVEVYVSDSASNINNLVHVRTINLATLTLGDAFGTYGKATVGEKVYLNFRAFSDSTWYSEFKDVKIEVEDYVKHTVTAVAETPATCVSDGTAAHYKCSLCGALCSDAAGTQVVAADSLVLPTDSNAHKYAATWSYNDEGHYHVCENGCDGNDGVVPHNIVEGDCLCECGYDALATAREEAAATVDTMTAPYGVAEGNLSAAGEAELNQAVADAKAAIADKTATKDADDIAAITATLQAVIDKVIQSYTVTFNFEEGGANVQQVPYGGSAVVPEIPAKEGYMAYWDVENFTNVTAAITANACYEQLQEVSGQITPVTDTVLGGGYQLYSFDEADYAAMTATATPVAGKAYELGIEDVTLDISSTGAVTGLLIAGTYDVVINNNGATATKQIVVSDAAVALGDMAVDQDLKLGGSVAGVASHSANYTKTAYNAVKFNSGASYVWIGLDAEELTDTYYFEADIAHPNTGCFVGVIAAAEQKVLIDPTNSGLAGSKLAYTLGGGRGLYECTVASDSGADFNYTALLKYDDTAVNAPDPAAHKIAVLRVQNDYVILLNDKVVYSVHNTTYGASGFGFITMGSLNADNVCSNIKYTIDADVVAALYTKIGANKTGLGGSVTYDSGLVTYSGNTGYTINEDGVSGTFTEKNSFALMSGASGSTYYVEATFAGNDAGWTGLIVNTWDAQLSGDSTTEWLGFGLYKNGSLYVKGTHDSKHNWNDGNGLGNVSTLNANLAGFDTTANWTMGVARINDYYCVTINGYVIHESTYTHKNGYTGAALAADNESGFGVWEGRHLSSGSVSTFSNFNYTLDAEAVAQKVTAAGGTLPGASA